jgi:hypothetical protein
VFNIITDILFATLPIPLIWKLRLNLRAKLSLIGVLSLGWFACAAAIIKAIQQWHVLEDPDWTVEDSFNIWNYIELTIGIIAASLPPLKPLFKSFRDATRSLTSSKTKDLRGLGYTMQSSGYHEIDKEPGNSIALQSMSTGNQVQVSCQHELAKNETKTTISDPRGSDDSIVQLQDPEVGHNGIMIKKEVLIT